MKLAAAGVLLAAAPGLISACAGEGSSSTSRNGDTSLVEGGFEDGDATLDAAPGDFGERDAAFAEAGPVVFGCPTYPAPLTSPGGASQDRFENVAAPFFAAYCTRCHASDLATNEERGFAPAGLDWDDEAVVRRNLGLIRAAIGVSNFMPPADPMPSCEERRRLVRWIDRGAP